MVEANAVLSDARRRERYDLGEDEDGLNEGGMGGFGAGMRPADLQDLFSSFSRGGPQFGFGGSFASFGPGNFSGGGGPHTHGFEF